MNKVETTGQFVKRLLSSNLLADSVVLFRRNPGLIDTVDGIARRLGASPKELKKEIEVLRQSGILRKDKIGNYEIITFDTAADARIQQQIGKQLSSLGKRRRSR